MANDKPEPREERAQTDESLRVEREKADQALGDELAAIDETADAVISKARARADAVLARARAATDRQSMTIRDPESTRERRAAEDTALERERARADEELVGERADHVALLKRERAETDKDLFSERVRSDDSLAMRDAFMGIVSHDLRNILNGMVGFAGLIAKEVDDADHVDNVRRHALRIQRSGGRMNRLIGDLVDVASIESGVLTVTRELADPAQVVVEAVDTFLAQATAAGISLVAEPAADAPPVPFDSARILQVLTNFLSNAIKFTAAGGRVVVRSEKLDTELQISVHDTGMGIPPDQLEAVFERFRQLKPNDHRGVGLGLYISKCIVLGHGGRIWAESEIGKGSTISFTLPLSAE